MGFVTPALLAGAALVAVPIVLHLVMRREVKQLKFPALRFVQQRRSLNQHRLRLRQLLLLALRCAIICLLAFALARPTLHGSGKASKEGAAVATVLVFDNSLRMQYEQGNKTRLAEAKELASWILEQLPPESPVTVVDRAGHQRAQDSTRDAVELRVEKLELSAAVRPMQDALQDTTRWLADKPDHRGEIYVFTDMAAEAWSDEALAEFRKALDNLEGANVYLVDVGTLTPNDIGLDALKIGGGRLAPGGVLRLDTSLVATGTSTAGNETVVELWVRDKAAAPEKRGEQTLKSEGDKTEVEFSLTGLDVGSHQGFVRIAGTDALPCDNVRYFTVDVQPPSKILLLSQSPEDAVFLREALAPSAGAGQFACEVRSFDDLGKLATKDYAAIFLIDPPALSPAAWQTLQGFAEAGGGIGVFLGRHARRDELNQREAQRLLPAKLRWQSQDATYLRPVGVEHPALSELRDVADTAPWPEFPVLKYWELEAGDTPAHVVATFANGKPAIVEGQAGEGRVLMMTTPVSDPAHSDPWNLLPTAPDPWPFLALANGIAQYLAGSGDTSLNYAAGQTATFHLAPSDQLTGYVLQMPDDSTSRQPVAPGQPMLSISATEELGNYRVQAGGNQGKFDRGFSVNLPVDLSQLSRRPTEQISEALGKDRVVVARSRDEIEVRVGVGRVGRELFPALILAVALVLAAEQWLSNRFYDSAGAPPALKSRREGKEVESAAEASPPTSLPVSSSPTLPLSPAAR